MISSCFVHVMVHNTLVERNFLYSYCHEKFEIRHTVVEQAAQSYSKNKKDIAEPQVCVLVRYQSCTTHVFVVRRSIFIN